ncbi:MAG: DUF305 domain-containing protein [Nocardioides sp.]|nr:DUF305 domain-containing protein [Nocardioides sp.]
MRSQTAVMMAGLTVLVASIATAVVMTVTHVADSGPGHRDSMSAGSGAMAQMHGTRVESEYDYLSEMVAHHEEAVAAARELERSERPEMRAFGASIVGSQTAQIDQMVQWLDEWYPDRSGRVDYEPMMRDLTGLSGDELDRAFLQDMTGHHMGAVMMSQQLLVGDLVTRAEVEELATTIRDDQHAEIFQMQQWLHEWFGR